MAAQPPTRFQTCIDWICLAMMSIAAAWIGVGVHSMVVFRRGTRGYRATVWELDEGPRMWILIAVEVIITFVILLPFLRRTIWCWGVWLCLVGFWIFFHFLIEPQ